MSSWLEGPTRPSNFVVFVMVFVAVVLVWFAWGTVHHDRNLKSSDQLKLIKKSQQGKL